MLFEHVRALLSESVARLALYELVDEVSGLVGPIAWDLLLVDLHLFRQDVVADLLPILPVVWSLTKHAFIGDHTHCEVVDSNAVVLTAHDFRRHVARRSRSVLRVLGVPQTSNTQIGHP